MSIYFIHQDERGNWLMKIGRAKDMRRRLRQLQTGNPKELKIVGWIVSENDHLRQRALHKKYSSANVGGEWFNLQPVDILEDLQAAGIDGFVAKNTDAFEVIGYDRDAVPEYMGVWDWGDLDIEECCPFFGCMCGMAFQNASQMYHCRSCDELTDFSENAPDFDNEEVYLAWKTMRDARKAQINVTPPKRRFLE
ncbi:MAG: GIY-YIG nuclease family protein [Paracoccaceae bacterium]